MNWGFISIHRTIEQHWLWDNNQYFSAWIKILLAVNHEQKEKILIKGTLFNCDRGESLRSISGWVQYLGQGWTKAKLETFFRLLKNETMIKTVNERKTLRLSVCNYDTYQYSEDGKAPQVRPQKGRKQDADKTLKGTNNNKNKDNNDNNIDKAPAEQREPYADLKFESAWVDFGRLGSKQKAKGFWKRLTDSQREEIIRIIPARVASQPNEKFRGHFASWINPANENWKNKIISNANGVIVKRDGVVGEGCMKFAFTDKFGDAKTEIADKAKFDSKIASGEWIDGDKTND